MAAARVTVGNLPAPVDLQLYQGDDFYLTVTVFDSSTGGGVDLTGYTAQSQIRVTPPSTEVLAEFDVVVVAGTSGQITLHLDHVDSAVIDRAGSWDLQMTDPAGVITTLCYGAVKLVQEVTR
jgi:ribulose 1,5-bisphosphate synthetase/thiazole synthase